MNQKIVYFEVPGKNNTDEVFSIAKQRASELGIKTILVASTTGWTAVKAADAFKNFKVIAVTHSYGFKGPNTQEFTVENRKLAESKGVVIFTATHAFGGLSRSMRQSAIPQASATYVIGDIVAATLKIFCQGMKVTCEIASMAADAGLVKVDEDVISIAGTGSAEAGRGADTAVVLTPAYSQLFFETKVKEILCKPRL